MLMLDVGDVISKRADACDIIVEQLAIKVKEIIIIGMDSNEVSLDI
jgi:hypothetical protein